MATYTKVKRYKRGAFWPDGETRTCTRCRIEKNRGERSRANQATTIAMSNGTLPVGYCDGHVPDTLEEGNDR